MNFERVLIIHPFGLGDALFMSPVIRSLKENGTKQIDLLLGSRTRELFEHNPHVNQIFEWDKSPVLEIQEKWNRFKKLAKLFWVLWNRHYQIVIDFSPSAQYAFLSWILFWIPIRIGFNFKGHGIFLTHKVELPDGYARKSVVEYYLELLSFLGVVPQRKQPELFLTDEDEKEAERILEELGIDASRGILAVAPGGGESWGKDARLKRWPVEYFAKLIRDLCQSYPSHIEHILILGGQNEYALGSQLLEAFKGLPAHNLCGKTAIRVSAAMVRKASCFIGNDGGLVHMAHVLGAPLIAIYGPVDPVVYGPYPADSKALLITRTGPACRPCYQRFRYQAECAGVECLRELTADHVFKLIQSNRFFERLFAHSVSK